MIRNPKFIDRLYLAQANDDTIYIDNNRIPQQTIDGIRFLYKQFRKRKNGVILNDPFSFGRNIQICLFVKAIRPLLHRPILILCQEGSERDWVDRFDTWTNESLLNEVAIELVKPFTNKMVMINTMVNLHLFCAREWSIIIVDGDQVTTPNPILKLPFKACFKIWNTSVDVKKNLDRFEEVYKWLYPRAPFEKKYFIADSKNGVDAIEKAILIDTLCEDIVLRRDDGFSLESLHRPCEKTPQKCVTDVGPSKLPPYRMIGNTSIHAVRRTTVTPTNGDSKILQNTRIYGDTTITPTNVAPTKVTLTNVAPTNVAPTNVAPTNVAPTNVAPTNVTPTNVAPTTVPPTNVAPTTVSPTTVSPTIVAPTTIAPTTVAPTTVAPTIVAPTTVAPTTVAPTTVAPTIVAPTTVAPTTVAPTTVAPTTVAPTTVAPTTVAPTTVAPTTVAPSTSYVPTLTITKKNKDATGTKIKSSKIRIIESETANKYCVPPSVVLSMLLEESPKPENCDRTNCTTVDFSIENYTRKNGQQSMESSKTNTDKKIEINEIDNKSDTVGQTLVEKLEEMDTIVFAHDTLISKVSAIDLSANGCNTSSDRKETEPHTILTCKPVGELNTRNKLFTDNKRSTSTMTSETFSGCSDNIERDKKNDKKMLKSQSKVSTDEPEVGITKINLDELNREKRDLGTGDRTEQLIKRQKTTHSSDTSNSYDNIIKKFSEQNKQSSVSSTKVNTDLVTGDRTEQLIKRQKTTHSSDTSNCYDNIIKKFSEQNKQSSVSCTKLNTDLVTGDRTEQLIKRQKTTHSSDTSNCYDNIIKKFSEQNKQSSVSCTKLNTDLVTGDRTEQLIKRQKTTHSSDSSNCYDNIIKKFSEQNKQSSVSCTKLNTDLVTGDRTEQLIKRQKTTHSSDTSNSYDNIIKKFSEQNKQTSVSCTKLNTDLGTGDRTEQLIKRQKTTHSSDTSNCYDNIIKKFSEQNKQTSVSCTKLNTDLGTGDRTEQLIKRQKTTHSSDTSNCYDNIIKKFSEQNKQTSVSCTKLNTEQVANRLKRSNVDVQMKECQETLAKKFKGSLLDSLF